MSELTDRARVYETLYDGMMEQFWANEFEACERMAHSLLSKPDLPVIIRARCYMMLGTSGSDPKNAHSGFLNYAESAVHLLEDAKEQGIVIKDETITEARDLLAQAREDHASLKAAGAYNGEAVTASASGEGGGQLGHPVGGITNVEQDDSHTKTAVGAKQKQSRRVDSGHPAEEDQPQELDGRARKGVGTGMATEPLAELAEGEDEEMLLNPEVEREEVLPQVAEGQHDEEMLDDGEK